VITNKSEYDCVASLMNKLAVIREDRITPEQERLLDLLTLLIGPTTKSIIKFPTRRRTKTYNF
jgi:hypothetical protein